MSEFRRAIEATRIVRPPKHHLATFGPTALRYVLVSETPSEAATCRVREGIVTAERPSIVTPEIWKEQFSGFGEDASDYAEQIYRHYGQALRSLEYKFRNDLQSTTLEHTSLIEMTDRVRARLEAEDALRTALLQGPDNHWSLSIMKFILDMTMNSFPSNVRELEDRGMFDPEKRQQEMTRRHIEQLFAKATVDRSFIKTLGEALRSAGLFGEYEDRFFSLMKNSA
jgi:hypothetical protein